MRGQEDGWGAGPHEDLVAQVVPRAVGLPSLAPAGDASGRVSPGSIQVPTRRMAWYEQLATVVAVALLAAVGAWWFSPQRRLPNAGDGFVGTIVRGRIAWIVHPPMINVTSEANTWKTNLIVSNPWKVPIKITQARASCHCTVSTVPKEPIPAGGQVAVPVEVSIGGSGDVTQVFIELETDSGHRQIHQLSLVDYRTLYVLPMTATDDHPRFSQNLLDLGEIQFGKAVRGQWYVQLVFDRQDGDGPVEVELKSTGGSGLVAQLGPLQPMADLHEGRIGRYRALLHVELPAEKAKDSGVDTLMLRVLVPGHPHHEVPLNLQWRLHNVLETEPAVALVEVAPGQSGPQRLSVRLRHVNGTAFRLRHVRSEEGWLTIQADFDRLSAEHEVVCIVDVSQIEEWATGELVLETEIEGCPNARVPISVRRAKPDSVE